MWLWVGCTISDCRNIFHIQVYLFIYFQLGPSYLYKIMGVCPQILDLIIRDWLGDPPWCYNKMGRSEHDWEPKIDCCLLKPRKCVYGFFSQITYGFITRSHPTNWKLRAPPISNHFFVETTLEKLQQEQTQVRRHTTLIHLVLYVMHS